MAMATRNAKRRGISRRGWVVRFLLIALALYLGLKAIQLYGQIREKQQALASFDNRIQTQIVINEGLTDQVENADEYLEQQAYEDGYGWSGQQVYQSEAG